MEGNSPLASGFLIPNPGEHIRRLQRMAETSASCELERLAEAQARTARNYFRLIEVDRRLRARVSRQSRSTGAIMADAMQLERQRIGRELHTSVGQTLAGIRVHLSLIRELLPEMPDALRHGLDRVEQLAGAALEQVRSVSRRLYIPAWQALPLVEAMQNLWDSSGIPERFDATLKLEELSAEPPFEVRRALYLAAQEGISNIIQHANATRVCMSLTANHGILVLTLADNGSGFAPPPPAGTPTGIGLRSLRDLTHELGGEFEAASDPRGTRLTVSFRVNHE